MDKQLVVIVVIAHKTQLSREEKASLRQCYKVLGRYPIKIICPEGLDVSAYKEINPEADIVFIDPKWQASYAMFNELKKAPLLYEMFRNYEYMLYYELDAWVFRDELEYWCSKGYDYIGAPWFEGFSNPTSFTFRSGGNGGFSLRKVSAARKIVRRVRQLQVIRKFWYTSHLQGVIRLHNVRLIRYVYKVGSFEQVSEILFNWESRNEDLFWSYYVPAVFNDFRSSSVNEAIRFSFEAIPSYLYQLNDNQLPFGCHAWQRYEPDFWNRFLKFT